jgi:hypothetical protein
MNQYYSTVSIIFWFFFVFLYHSISFPCPMAVLPLLDAQSLSHRLSRLSFVPGEHGHIDPERLQRLHGILGIFAQFIFQAKNHGNIILMKQGLVNVLFWGF